MTNANNIVDILIDLKDSARLINRFWSNLCKLGKDKITISVVEQRKILLERYWENFQTSHRQLIHCEGADESEYIKNDVYQTVEEAYLDAISKLACSFKTLNRSERASTSDIKNQTNTDETAVLKQIQLPKIELPTFSGNRLHWESFRDLFRSLVHNVTGLSDVQKLLYLKASLSGEAAGVIQNTTNTDAGYQGAWDDLETRYGNERILSFSHFHNLISCSPAKKSSPVELKRLLDIFRQSIRGFKALKKPVQHWDEWFVYILVQKLDPSTHLDWETSLANSRTVPAFSQLSDFLENRIHALESAHSSDFVIKTTTAREVSKNDWQSSSSRKTRVSSYSTSTGTSPKTRKCQLCSGTHSLSYCPKFKKLPAMQRLDQGQRLGACHNCLSSSHSANDCFSKSHCLVCTERHHTLLHDALSRKNPSDQPRSSKLPPISLEKASTILPSAPGTSNSSQPIQTLSYSVHTNNVVLLATAQIIVASESGKMLKLKALIDTASDTSLVSKWVVQSLNLPTQAVHVNVAGVHDSEAGTATEAVNFIVRSNYDKSFELPVKAIVLSKLTSKLPQQRVVKQHWPHLRGLTLADPQFAVPARVDVILGADVCASLLMNDSRQGQPGSPVAKLSPFGWILMGPTSLASSEAVSTRAITCCAITNDTLPMDLRRFWELEEVSSTKPMSEDDKNCEEHFQRTHARDDTGRFVVRLPFKLDASTHLSSSRNPALNMWLNCERRLIKNPSLKSKYDDFMNAYLDLEHMEAVPKNDVEAPSYYLPHHAVTKANDPSEKIRVVFNASSKTKSGYSLNDCLFAGPKLQTDIGMIITRWRMFRIVFATDIVKMFRQIEVHPADTEWQRILWRQQPNDALQDFRLTTVTYGTTSAPYLALRVLKQLAQDERGSFPLGAQAIEDNSYVDDILSGADDLNQAEEKISQLINMLASGGFPLSKWASNVPDLCPEGENAEKFFTEIDTISTLGISWSPTDDSFSIKVTPMSRRIVSKRSVLSEVARLFDPLGWVAPVLISAKILLQDIWIAGIDWDQELPLNLAKVWECFRSTLLDLEHIRIPRWVSSTEENRSRAQLHGFSDASERAYAAAVYFRVTDKNGNVNVHLLVAKTKVAPVKTVSVPRLELCAAVLLTRLMVSVIEHLKIFHIPIFAWSDSQVSLSWIHGHASKWPTFVANRVAEVQSLLPAQHWRHVRTHQNPADLATRGITPTELFHSEMWWKGPSWLREQECAWPTISFNANEAEDVELKRLATCHSVQVLEPVQLLERYSSISRLKRITAFCFRFIFNVRHVNNKRTGYLTLSELANAERVLIIISQRTSFGTECTALNQKSRISTSSPLLRFRPFLDDEGLLRIGGRLQNALLSNDEKHPLILSKRCPLARLLIRDAHRLTLHGGPQLVQSYLLRRYWILRGRSLIRAMIKECVTCARHSGRTSQQVMAHLPPRRLQPTRPFLNAGVDFAGPIMLRTTRGRGHKAYKGYISLFICLSTKAIHLEVVSDLTSNAFIAAFKRFVSRRGRCAQLMSDNGSNFRGADKVLRSMFHEASSFYQDAAESLANDGTAWSFIPPAAPHFGGLWEAGVKSTKFHLRRIIGESTLTFEEMATLLCQIEACLNSRPLCAMSTDPSDLASLTPGHFLIGESMTAIPEPGPSDQLSPMNRWRLISNMRDHFWRRWSSEYVVHQQRLGKWPIQHRDLEVGRLVLIKDELRPPTKWVLGRIVQVHPGPDGHTRVVTLRTAQANVLRPITKICPLPIPSTE